MNYVPYTLPRTNPFSTNDHMAEPVLAVETERLCWQYPDELPGWAGAVCATQGAEDGKLWLISTCRSMSARF